MKTTGWRVTLEGVWERFRPKYVVTYHDGEVVRVPVDLCIVRNGDKGE